MTAHFAILDGDNTSWFETRMREATLYLKSERKFRTITFSGCRGTMDDGKVSLSLRLQLMAISYVSSILQALRAIACILRSNVAFL